MFYSSDTQGIAFSFFFFWGGWCCKGSQEDTVYSSKSKWYLLMGLLILWSLSCLCRSCLSERHTVNRDKWVGGGTFYHCLHQIRISLGRHYLWRRVRFNKLSTAAEFCADPSSKDERWCRLGWSISVPRGDLNEFHFWKKHTRSRMDILKDSNLAIAQGKEDTLNGHFQGANIKAT